MSVVQAKCTCIMAESELIFDPIVDLTSPQGSVDATSKDRVHVQEGRWLYVVQVCVQDSAKVIYLFRLAGCSHSIYDKEVTVNVGDNLLSLMKIVCSLSMSMII